MNTLLKALALSTLLTLVACTSAPSIEKVQEETTDDVENLLTEDNNDELYFRFDRYFLSEQVDDLTYKGTVKSTAFYQDRKWDDNKHKFVNGIDSLKLYRTVIIKFRDKKYDYYTVTIEGAVNN